MRVGNIHVKISHRQQRQLRWLLQRCNAGRDGVEVLAHVGAPEGSTVAFVVPTDQQGQGRRGQRTVWHHPESLDQSCAGGRSREVHEGHEAQSGAPDPSG